MPSPETGSISPAASPTSSDRSETIVVPGGRIGSRWPRNVLQLVRTQAVRGADSRKVLAQVRPLRLPRAHADVHVVPLREHPAVAARNVGELDHRAPRISVVCDARVRDVPLESDAVDDAVRRARVLAR